MSSPSAVGRLGSGMVFYRLEKLFSELIPVTPSVVDSLPEVPDLSTSGGGVHDVLGEGGGVQAFVQAVSVSSIRDFSTVEF